jgi:hypothetical protein
LCQFVVLNNGFINTTDIETITRGNGKVLAYKNQYSDRKVINKYTEKLKNEICINGLPENAPSSLHHACNELNCLKN